MSSDASGSDLTGAEKKTLRRLAHSLRPIVQLGGAGLTEGVLNAIDRALEDHELIKLKLLGERDERRSLADEVATQTRSSLAGMVGRIAILYRPARDPERRRVDPSGGG